MLQELPLRMISLTHLCEHWQSMESKYPDEGIALLTKTKRPKSINTSCAVTGNSALTLTYHY